MHPPSSLGFPMDRNMFPMWALVGSTELLLPELQLFLYRVPVMVPVTTAPLPLGGLHSRMFPGGPRLQCLNSV